MTRKKSEMRTDEKHFCDSLVQMLNVAASIYIWEKIVYQISKKNQFYNKEKSEQNKDFLICLIAKQLCGFKRRMFVV